jgi:hypothetical protein
MSIEKVIETTRCVLCVLSKCVGCFLAVFKLDYRDFVTVERILHVYLYGYDLNLLRPLRK